MHTLLKNGRNIDSQHSHHHQAEQQVQSNKTTMDEFRMYTFGWYWWEYIICKWNLYRDVKRTKTIWIYRVKISRCGCLPSFGESVIVIIGVGVLLLVLAAAVVQNNVVATSTKHPLSFEVRVCYPTRLCARQILCIPSTCLSYSTYSKVFYSYAWLLPCFDSRLNSRLNIYFSLSPSLSCSQHTTFLNGCNGATCKCFLCVMHTILWYTVGNGLLLLFATFTSPSQNQQSACDVEWLMCVCFSVRMLVFAFKNMRNRFSFIICKQFCNGLCTAYVNLVVILGDSSSLSLYQTRVLSILSIFVNNLV